MGAGWWGTRPAVQHCCAQAGVRRSTARTSWARTTHAVYRPGPPPTSCVPVLTQSCLTRCPQWPAVFRGRAPAMRGTAMHKMSHCPHSLPCCCRSWPGAHGVRQARSRPREGLHSPTRLPPAPLGGVVVCVTWMAVGACATCHTVGAVDLSMDGPLPSVSPLLFALAPLPALHCHDAMPHCRHSLPCRCRSWPGAQGVKRARSSSS